MKQNSNPSFHFLGIGGVGMAGLAYLLKRLGFVVSGCDKYATTRTRWLEAAGIPVALGHAPDHLEGIDELIITPAVPPAEAELAEARRREHPSPAETTSAISPTETIPGTLPTLPALKIRSRGEVLAELVNASDGIAVCGTHGKTTTATFTAKLLALLGNDPSWCIGGECGEMPVAHASPAWILSHQSPTTNYPQPSPLVVEADESDGTLALYHARTLVITSLDYDHPEHFKTIEAYHACFAQAANQSAEVIRSWELDSSDWPELEHLVLGRHNVTNARAAIEVALRRGYTPDQIRPLLPQALSTLPDRRFQRIFPPPASLPTPMGTDPNSPSMGTDPNLDPIEVISQSKNRKIEKSKNYPLSVYTDYAHHPAELACAVSMAASLKPHRLRVLFQPHRYSRTKSLKDEFPAAFAAADEVVLIPVYPAFEKPIPGGDIADLYLSFRNFQLSSLGPEPQSNNRKIEKSKNPLLGTDPIWPHGLLLARSAEEAWRHVFLTREPGDLILLAGAGDIINLVPRILADLNSPMGTVPSPLGTDPKSKNQKIKKSKNLSPFSFFRTGGETFGGGKPIILGMGSNTWFSDCATDIEILRAPTDGDSPLGSLGPKNGDSPLGPESWIPAGIIGASLLQMPEIGNKVAFMAGIPGTLGGWVKMNAGAFGHSISETIDSIRVQLFNENGNLTDKVMEIPAEKCGFAYRTSSIPGIILAVRFKSDKIEKKLTSDGSDQIDGRTTSGGNGNSSMDTAADYLAKRKRFPPRTCGSVFKNPSLGNPAGMLLEESGAKKLRVGGACVWTEHANVIVANEGATSSDILALVRLMAAAVYFKYDIHLEPEIRGLGDYPVI